MSNWKTICAWCAGQLPHDCNERRAAEAEIKALGAVPTVAETLFQPIALSEKDLEFIADRQLTQEQIDAMKAPFGIPAEAFSPTASEVNHGSD